MSRQAPMVRWLFTRRKLWPSWLGVWLRPLPLQRTCGPTTACFMLGRKPWSWTAKDECAFPPELAALAGLGKEAVLVGVLDHLELWDRGRWEQYVADRQNQYDQIAEAAFEKPAS